ncbi:hypothetical protein D0864_00552 [Hortaea werneckii]|uniref:Uncharacterized protein n=1 Tax=Hortaea werneckii TaxID=91943 RepID=A0A3M7HII9_HORWE|nr:hypothetical protein D0864_00552 [Hortaea werneckii]
MPPKPSPPTSHRENIAQHPHRNPDYGGNPLAHIHSNNSDGTQSLRLPAFAGGLQPGLYKPPPFKFGNPVPLGLSGFALTTFLLSMINLNTRNLGGQSSMVMAPAYAYGGFVQLLAGMWEIVLGNVFGGTALSTYGGFWISLGIILTPGGFRIEHAYGIPDFYTGTNVLLKSCPELGLFADMSSSFRLLYFCLDDYYHHLLALHVALYVVAASLMCSTAKLEKEKNLAQLLTVTFPSAYLDAASNDGVPDPTLTRLSGGFGIAAAFIAWYNMIAGIADPSNSFFMIPVVHFPWSDKGREQRKAKRDRNDSDASDRV